MRGTYFWWTPGGWSCVGACYDPKAMLCTVGLKQPVDYTIANGKICVARGRLTGVDEREACPVGGAGEVRRYLA